MKFQFYIISPHGEALKDITWCETHPVGGSETAALRMAQSLKKLGHEVEIATDTSELQENQCDIFIALRHNHIFKDKIRFGRLQYLWCQDDIDQPILKKLCDDIPFRETVYESLNGFILVSYYQYHRWLAELKIPHQKAFVSSNGISYQYYQGRVGPTPRPQQAYYASAPFRGLEILLKMWPTIHKAAPKAILKIYSSMKFYGAEETKKYEEMYAEAHSLPGVDYCGSVSQAELREAAFQSRVLAYPCTFPETSCITAMEAMAAGCVVASTSLGAMPETAWRNPLVSPHSESWVEMWTMQVARLLVDDPYFDDLSRQNQEFSSLFDWELVAKKWLLRFRSDSILQGIPLK